MRLILGLVCCLALAACRSPDAAVPPLGLVGEWELIGGESEGAPFPLVEGFRITVNFAADGTFGGTSACNGYGGSYVADGEDLIIGRDVFATAMACDGPVMDSETAYLGILQEPLTYQRTGDRLTIRGLDAQLDFRTVDAIPAADLVDTTWNLTSWGVGDVVSNAVGDPATLLLGPDGQVNGSTGCRTLNGSYIIDADTVRLTSFSALGECSGEITAQDGHVVTVLGDGFTAMIDGDTLTVHSVGNEFLVYQR